MAFYKARTGQQRAYLSSGQAIAYERAFAAYPAAPWGLPESAAMDGFKDAKAAADASKNNAAAAHAASFTEHRGETTCAA